MEQIENDKYLETPLTQRLEEFKTYFEEQWKKQWSERDVKIMQDAYCVGISEMRVERDLYQSNYIGIYKNIIINSRSLECQAKQQQDNAWEEQLKMIRKYYQVELLRALTLTIQYFCMEN